MRLYRAYEKAHPGPLPPSLVVMASFLEELRSELRNSSGVAYEVPAVSAFVSRMRPSARASAKACFRERG